jgi:hypothetical protein
MLDMSKLLLKTSGICLTVKFKVFKIKKLRWLTRSKIDSLIWKICSMNLSKKVNKMRKRHFNLSSSMSRSRDYKRKLKLLNNK